MKDCMYMLPLGMPVPVHARGHPLKTPHPLSPQQKVQCREFFSFCPGPSPHSVEATPVPWEGRKNNSIKSDIFCFSCGCRPCPPRLL
ncbi:hypothetical protein V8C43DRAFT_274072 [Trichoderma afarasin]